MTQHTPNRPTSESRSVVSLFCGCGGLDLGFTQTGFEVKMALDHDPTAINSYIKNIGHHAEIADVNDPDFIERLSKVGTCDVLLGGFPCQGFSKAGPKREQDERNLLYQSMISGLNILRPRVFLAENVDGLLQNYNGAFLQKITDDCARAGYNVEWKIVDAAWFGVPQHRRRILIVGIRSDLKANFTWPIATHKWIARNGEKAIHSEYQNWVESPLEPQSIEDAFQGIDFADADHKSFNQVTLKTQQILARIPEGGKLCNARHDSSSIRTWEIPEAFGPVTERECCILEIIARNRRHKKYGQIPNGNPLSLTVLQSLVHPHPQAHELDALVERGYLKKVKNKWDLRGAMFASGLYKRPLYGLPAPTVLTVFGNPRYFAHPREARPFTVREAARLQTFPDSYEFTKYGIETNDAFRLIGNAVPPRLARCFAKSIEKTLKNSELAMLSQYNKRIENVVA